MVIYRKVDKSKVNTIIKKRIAQLYIMKDTSKTIKGCSTKYTNNLYSVENISIKQDMLNN